jgi:hypothetical protein
MTNINERIFDQVVETAKQKTGGDSRWVNAITRAAEEIRTNPYLHESDDALLVLSSTSLNIYTANGTCQCEAFSHGRACWHRAAHRLFQLYNEMAACLSRESTLPVAPRAALGGKDAARVEQKKRLPLSALFSSKMMGGRRVEHVGGISI